MTIEKRDVAGRLTDPNSQHKTNSIGSIIHVHLRMLPNRSGMEVKLLAVVYHRGKLQLVGQQPLDCREIQRDGRIKRSLFCGAERKIPAFLSVLRGGKVLTCSL